MGESPRQSWVRTAVLLGIGYALVGIAFAVPATHMQAWRLAAWVVSAMGYAVHIAYERFRLQNSPGSAALHVAFAVALGAFGLAVGANIHSLSAGSTSTDTSCFSRSGSGRSSRRCLRFLSRSAQIWFWRVCSGVVEGNS